MKLILTTLMLSITFLSTAQNIKRIIDKNDSQALKTFINETEVIEDDIYTPAYKYGNETKVFINPLEYAVLVNNFDFVKQLTKKQDKYEDFNETISKAFELALMNNNQSIADYLYQFHPNINEVCSICNGNNAVMFAAENGNAYWYFKLVAQSEINLINNDGNNLVHLCAENYNDSIFYDVLSEGVDINLSNKNKKTPLQVSALKGVEKMFYRLIDNNANYETIDDLYADAVLGGNLKILNYFEKEKMFEPSFLWFTYPYKINNDKPKEYYPYELAILSQNPKVLDVVVNKMMSDIKTDSTNEHIKTTYQLLSGTGDDYDHISLTYAIAMGEKEMFENVLKASVEFNNRDYKVTYKKPSYSYEQDAQVYFTKFDYRAAKRKFGKEYVTNLYKSLGIKF